MSPKRIKQRYEDFEKALMRLKEAVREDPSKSSLFVDGTLQRFEFTFELAWKLAQDILDYHGMEARNPRSTIKEAYKDKLISDGDGWILMLDARNKTSHIYDEAEALKVFEEVKANFINLLEELKVKAAEVLKEFE